MKKIIAFLCIFLLFFTATAHGAPIDPQREASLTLQYRRGEQVFPGLTVKTFRVAEVFADGTFALTGEFKKYPVNIYGITTREEWKNIASTLSAYATADQLAPTFKAATDETGGVFFSGIRPGMYLTQSVRTETVVFEDVLTVIPQTNENEEPLYSVTAYPKSRSFSLRPELLNYKVVKQWKDSEYPEKRPESVQIEILKDGVLQSTQTLSAANNWCYSWSAEDDGSKWQAVEREIPGDYTVTVTESSTTITITNAYQSETPGEESPPPNTGDTFVLWPYLLAMCLSGGLLVLLALWNRRKEV
ncbi:MAG: Cna B-type domain-containing protein [Clostridia bacterium]|nr:Cna B-type domain-containing protein [Clostridia bacterium]MBQ8893214.1 Cna B-type domain-containing protein [Clostridia bacterium]